MLQHMGDAACAPGTYAAPLRTKAVDAIATEDVLGMLKPIWSTKAETASRLRGRIERVLNAAKAKGHRSGENPAAWRGHLENLLPKRQSSRAATMRPCRTPTFPRSSRASASAKP